VTEQDCQNSEIQLNVKLVASHNFLVAMVIERLPLWSCGQSSWLQIQRFRFDSRRYQILWEVVGLELGPLSLVSAIEELLGRKSNDSSLERREYTIGIRHADHVVPLYPQKLALTSPTSGGCSVGIGYSRTQATEFSLVLWWLNYMFQPLVKTILNAQAPNSLFGEWLWTAVWFISIVCLTPWHCRAFLPYSFLRL
jgi:hypothetical protein